MGEFADRLAAIVVTVDSPDGHITARLRAGQLDAVEFRVGAYRRYLPLDLEHQFARTATLLHVEYQRRRRRVSEEAGLHWVATPTQARDEAERRYLEEVQAISVTGSSPHGAVSFTMSGTATWRCRIADDALSSLSEPAFVAETMAAAQELLRRSRFEKALLKNQFFGARPAEPTRERLQRAAQSSGGVVDL